MNLENKKALCLVAHPDDETIWMGGTIFNNPKTDWTIFSLCRSSDPDRAPKFKKVCKYYRAGCIMTDLDDENDIKFEQLVKDAKKIIKENVDGKSFDFIFTHGENGEYGHDRHVVVHEAMQELISEGFFNGAKVYFFNYEKEDEDQEYSEMIPARDSDSLVDLTKQCHQRKRKEVMAGIYGFDLRGIDANLCTKREAFKEIEVDDE